jgi:hypothetical protein
MRYKNNFVKRPSEYLNNVGVVYCCFLIDIRRYVTVRCFSLFWHSFFHVYGFFTIYTSFRDKNIGEGNKVIRFWDSLKPNTTPDVGSGSTNILVNLLSIFYCQNNDKRIIYNFFSNWYFFPYNYNIQ